jgi:hypothetical protein
VLGEVIVELPTLILEPVVLKSAVLLEEKKKQVVEEKVEVIHGKHI